MPRLLETELRVRAKRHGPNALIRERDAAFVRDEQDLYVDRLNMGERVALISRFEHRTQLAGAVAVGTNLEWDLAGLNTVAGDSVGDPGGGNLIGSHGADGDRAFIEPHQTANQSAWKSILWATSRAVHFHCLLTPRSASMASMVLWAGLKLTQVDVKATDADQVYFRYQDTVNGGRWELVYSIGGTLVSVDAGTVAVAGGGIGTPVKDQKQMLSIIVDENRSAKCYIDGVLVATTPALTSLTTLVPSIGVGASGAAAVKSVAIHAVSMSQTIV